MQDRTLQTPKSSADVDRIIESFRQFYGRNPSTENLLGLNTFVQLLIDNHSGSMKAAADE